MKDFIGVNITPGSWLAGGAAGNVKAEYGMILFRVDAITDDKLKLTRLHVSYPDQQRPEITPTKVTATNSNKYVVVYPPQQVLDLFDRVCQGTATPLDMARVGSWVQGKKEGIWG